MEEDSEAASNISSLPTSPVASGTTPAPPGGDPNHSDLQPSVSHAPGTGVSPPSPSSADIDPVPSVGDRVASESSPPANQENSAGRDAVVSPSDPVGSEPSHLLPADQDNEDTGQPPGGDTGSSEQPGPANHLPDTGGSAAPPGGDLGVSDRPVSNSHGDGPAVPSAVDGTLSAALAADCRIGLPPDDQIAYSNYVDETQMPEIMQLIQRDLSEPYSIYTYRYFINNWPNLCFLARHEGHIIGAIVCKLDSHDSHCRRVVTNRGYIAMLAVDQRYRKRRIGSQLVLNAIRAMATDGADEVVLETEVTNTGALRLYENLGFVRDKRLFRYYLNGVDALRLKLWLWPP